MAEAAAAALFPARSRWSRGANDALDYVAGRTKACDCTIRDGRGNGYRQDLRVTNLDGATLQGSCLTASMDVPAIGHLRLQTFAIGEQT